MSPTYLGEIERGLIGCFNADRTIQFAKQCGLSEDETSALLAASMDKLGMVKVSRESAQAMASAICCGNSSYDDREDE